MSSKNISVLYFLLQDIQACIELRYVDKVLALPFLETVPSCPVYCAGLMNLRGKCIPVIDLAMSIGLVREDIYPLNIPVLLCDNGAHQIGLIVDKVQGMSDIDEKKMEIHEEFAHSGSPFFAAVTLETGVSLLINIDWVFTLRLTQEMNQTTES